MKNESLRNTPYAEELARVSVELSSEGDGRIEYLCFNSGAVKGMKGYRFSWWKNGNMARRPLDLTEREFLDLFKRAIEGHGFSAGATSKMRKILGAS